MAMSDSLRDKLKSFARDNLGLRSLQERMDENFDNGMEVALMKGFTRAAQNQFIKDLVKKAVDTAKPKKDMGGRKVKGFNVMVPDGTNGYSHYEYYTPAQFKKLGIPETSLRVTKVYDGFKPNTLTPKQTAPEASEELEKAIMTLPENIQDAYLYGQRNLDDYSRVRQKGDMNHIYPGVSQYYSGEENLPLGYKEHVIQVKPGEDIEPFVNDVLHEGGHRGDAGIMGTDNYSVERNLGRYLRKDIIDEIANADNPRQMIEELSGGNKAIKRLLADATGMHPEIRNPGNLQYKHKKSYVENWRDTYNKDLPANLMNRDEAVANGPMSSEGFAEIMGILGTEGGYEWMQKNAPAALRRFERINDVARIKAERALGPDGAVPERYNVNFHPELGD